MNKESRINLEVFVAKHRAAANRQAMADDGYGWFDIDNLMREALEDVAYLSDEDLQGEADGWKTY